MRAWILAAVAAFCLTGCSADVADYQLEAYGFSVTHSGSHSIYLGPMDAKAPEPTSCKAFVDGKEAGSCEVQEGREGYPWTLVAHYPETPTAESVIGYKGGVPVATWLGEVADDPWYLTE